jgi:hypothetical protein
MPQFTLNEADITGHVFGPNNPKRGDLRLIVERGLLDPTTGQKVGTITSVLTYMEVISRDDVFVLGIAEHHLNDNVKPPAREGVISVQGSFRFLQTDDPVFSIVGGTGGYRNARGTVTLGEDKFTYDVDYT